ncbi:MAG: hypothetical protein PVG90_02650 [Bacillota bacterium]|jgi:hypothetical protein
MAFSNWIGDLARKINGVMTTPSQQATQIAEQIEEENPLRTRISQMTGTPPADIVQRAALLDQNQQNYNLRRDQFNAETIPVGPETFAEANPNNQLAHILSQNPRRYRDDIFQSALTTEDQLKQQANQDKARQDAIAALNDPEFLKSLQGTQEGQNMLKQIELITRNPKAFGLQTAVNALTGGGQLAGNIAKDQTARQRLQERKQFIDNLVSQIPDSSPDKQRVLYDLQNAETEEQFNAAWNQAKGLIPQPISREEQLGLTKKELEIQEVKLKIAKLLRDGTDPNDKTLKALNIKLKELQIEKAKQDLNGGGSGSPVGDLGSKGNAAYTSGFEKAYAAEAKNNGGRLDVDGNWTFPVGKPMPNISNWIKKNYGENELRKYKAAKTGNQDYLDTSRSLTGIQTPGLIKNEWDLAADKLITQLGSFTKARAYAIENNYDKRLIAALDRRKKLLEQRQKR